MRITVLKATSGLLRVVLVGHGCFSFAQGWVAFAGAALAAPGVGGDPQPSGLARIILVMVVVDVGGWLLIWSTFVVWLATAQVGVLRHGRPGLAWRPYWALLGWLIPVANLVLPPLMVADVYRRSAPPWRREWVVPGVVIAWWIALLLTVFPDSGLTYDMATGKAPVSDFYSYGFLVSSNAGLATNLLAARIITRVTEWQDPVLTGPILPRT